MQSDLNCAGEPLEGLDFKANEVSTTVVARESEASAEKKKRGRKPGKKVQCEDINEESLIG